jgi:putative peptide zinc metalloprotease protein
MALVSGDASPGRGGTVASSRPEASPGSAGQDVLARADGVQLIGEMSGSGYREPPALVRRADGQTIQLTRLLYAVLHAVDGRSSDEEVADRVSKAYGRLVQPGDVRALVDAKLRPLGLLRLADGSQPQVKRSNPLLALRLRLAVTNPRLTRLLTTPFAWLFHPLVALPLLVGFGLVCWWLLLDRGLAAATYQAFDKPGLLLLIFAVSVFSAGFHEFGHASAARYGGATPGVMGMGVYLVWPAFYTDVTDSYRLGRGGRVRTDLGGLYFNAIVAVGIVGVWWVTGYEALLLVVVAQIVQMLRQLLPLVRFDGYHVLADLTGVPDLFQRIKPTLLGLLPWRWRSPEASVLKPWARAVVTGWVLVVVPLLVSTLVLMVLALPRVLATAWVNLQQQWAMLLASAADADWVDVGARVLSLVAIAFPILAMLYILIRLVRRVAVWVWRRTGDRPLHRALAVLTAVAVVAGLAWAWWPADSRYRPIQPYERGTLVDAVPASVGGPVDQSWQLGRMQTIWPAGMQMPTAERPALAMVLVPHGASGNVIDPTDTGDTQQVDATTSPSGGAVLPGTGTAPGTGAGATPGAEAPSWVFPFNKPEAPGPGDNQALAVNTQDGSTVYDVAFALVWVEDEPMLNRNEAYAFASCRDCTTVAVSFQVVLAVGQVDMVVPQNISAAVNYNCVECLTAAIATQLVVTLDGPLSHSGMQTLTGLWAQIAEFGRHIEGLSLTEIRDQLSAYEQQILDVIAQDRQGSASDASGGQSPPGAEPTPGADPPDGGSASAGGNDPGTGTTDGTGTSDGTSSGTSTGTDGSTADGGDTGSATGGTDPSPGPTPQQSTSPQPDPTPTASPPSSPTPAEASAGTAAPAGASPAAPSG